MGRDLRYTRGMFRRHTRTDQVVNSLQIRGERGRQTFVGLLDSGIQTHLCDLWLDSALTGA